MQNGKTIKAEGDTEINKITYPDGKIAFKSAGQIAINNILPTDKCEDIFYSKSKNLITAIDASGKFADSNVKQVCTMYSDVEQFCANGICKVTNATCGNNFDSEYGTCPSQLRPAIVFVRRAVLNTLQIFVPILLILLGSIDMAKAVMSNDDKALKDATAKLIRRVIIAVAFFFISTIVNIVVTRIAASTDIEGSEDWKACWNELN